MTFPDVRGAATDGETKTEALFEAADCLIAALGGYIELGRDIPAPSRPERKQRVVAVPPLMAAKLAVYQAMGGAG